MVHPHLTSSVHFRPPSVHFRPPSVHAVRLRVPSAHAVYLRPSPSPSSMSVHPPAATSKHTRSMLAQLCGTSHRTNSGSSVVVARLVGLTSDQGKHARTWFPHRVYGPFLIRLICLIPFSLAIAGNYVFAFNSFSPCCPPVIYSRT